ncbi:hypothetical protein ACFW9U_09910 [Rhodococcus aetherivorans]|uniref:hypothetical protein n=1 Tax=Rhodococcus aetherivorans TaxID=191292 RepID=UPI00366B8B4E
MVITVLLSDICPPDRVPHPRLRQTAHTVVAGRIRRAGDDQVPARQICATSSPAGVWHRARHRLGLRLRSAGPEPRMRNRFPPKAILTIGAIVLIVVLFLVVIVGILM